MLRDIVVFERDPRYAYSGNPELDYRLVRSILPSGSCPLAIANHTGFAVEGGQWFTAEEVRIFAEEQSGYRARRKNRRYG